MFERLSWLFFDFEFTATVINFLSKLSNHNKKVEFQKLTKQNKISRLNTHVHDFTDSNTITKWMNKSILSQIQLPFSIDLQTQFSKGLPKSIDKRFHVHFSHNSVMYHVYIKSIYNLNLRLKIFKIVRPKPIPIFKWHSSNISQSTTGHNSYLQRLFAHTHSCAIEFENEIKWCFPDNVKVWHPTWISHEFFGWSLNFFPPSKLMPPGELFCDLQQIAQNKDWKSCCNAPSSLLTINSTSFSGTVLTVSWVWCLFTLCYLN